MGNSYQLVYKLSRHLSNRFDRERPNSMLTSITLSRRASARSIGATPALAAASRSDIIWGPKIAALLVWDRAAEPTLGLERGASFEPCINHRSDPHFHRPARLLTVQTLLY